MISQYDESNIGEWLDPRDPDVMGRVEADTEDPIFKQLIEERRKQKRPQAVPSSFAAFDTVSSFNGLTKDSPQNRTQRWIKNT